MYKYSFIKKNETNFEIIESCPMYLPKNFKSFPRRPSKETYKDILQLKYNPSPAVVGNLLVIIQAKNMLTNLLN